MVALPDLSTANDTFSHTILVQRLHARLGLSGLALVQLLSYRQGIAHKLSTLTNQPARSMSLNLLYITEGSVLGPLLFCIYTLSLET